MIVGNDCCKECGLPLDGKGSCYPCDWHDPDAPRAQGEPRAGSESTQKDTATNGWQPIETASDEIASLGVFFEEPKDQHPSRPLTLSAWRQQHVPPLVFWWNARDRAITHFMLLEPPGA